MRWYRYSALFVLLGLFLSLGLYMYLTPRSKADSADEDAVLSRVREFAPKVPQMTLKHAAFVGERVIVQMSYAGSESEKPKEAVVWHLLAEETASLFYQEAIRNRGVELQLYEEGKLRAVAIAGL